MKFSVRSLTHQHFVLVPVRPEDYPEETMPGSEMSTAEGSFGKVVVQEICTEPFNIIYHYYNMLEKCVLEYSGDTPPLRILICLKGHTHFSIEPVGDIPLQQGQFNILYGSDATTRLVFDQPGEVLLFSLYLPANILLDYTVFPLEDFIQATRLPAPALLFQTPGWITSEVIRELTYLLAFHEEPQLQRYLFALKAKQLMQLLLMQKHYGGSEIVSQAILDRIRHARHIIESSIGEILTIDTVAYRAGISEYELKKYFKIVEGITVSTFIMQARLTNAKLLLQETDMAVKEIAQIAGYEHEQNFIQAFKKHFDYTPFFVRQKRF